MICVVAFLFLNMMLGMMLGNMDVDFFYSVQFEGKIKLTKRDLKPLLNLLCEAL